MARIGALLGGLGFGLVLVPVLRADAAQQRPDSAEPAEFLSEGPLDNDAFLPVAREAEALLTRGDEGFAALARRGTPLANDADRRAWLDVLESWHAALSSSVAGEGVPPRPWRGPPEAGSPWADPDGTAGGGTEGRPARRTEGVEYAVLRRLSALPEQVQRLWSERFGPLGEESLAAAGRSGEPLAEVERRHPATRAAALAALAPAALELECGRPAFALDWLEPARRHAELARAAAVKRALDRRAEPALPLARASETARASGTEAWRTASELQPVAQIPLADLSGRTRGFKPQPGKRFQSGLAWMEPTLAAIQTESNLVVLEPATGRIAADFEPLALLADRGLEVQALEPPRESPGWPCAPACTAGRVVLAVHAQPRVLLCAALDPAGVFGGPSLPRIEWAIADGSLFAQQGDGLQARVLDGWPGGEIQPGPLAWDGCVFVQVHAPEEEAPGTIRAHLVALDLATGRVRWSRMLARGSAVSRVSLRFLAPAPARTVAQPLVRVGSRIFAGTHLGVGALIDACDGRLVWTFKNRRRTPPQEGWTGTAPAVFVEPDGVVFAPADSDRVYWLRCAPALEGQGILLHPPRRIAEAEVLAEGDADHALVLARSGRERTLAQWDAAQGGGTEAARLGAREAFTGTAAASAARALFATDRGVYLHDRTRDLFLLDFDPFPSGFPAPGGQVVARDDRVLVIGPYLAWILRAR